LPETSVPVPAGPGAAGSPIAVYTDPAGNVRQVMVLGDPNLPGVATVTGDGELTAGGVMLELIYLELRRIRAQLEQLTGESILDEDITD
jgi:hypothetical protein